MNKAYLIFFASVLSFDNLISVQYNWITQGSGTWETASNWNPAVVPNSPTATPTFGQNPSIPQPFTVGVSSSPLINNLVLANPASVTINLANYLVFEFGYASPPNKGITVTQGSHVINGVSSPVIGFRDGGLINSNNSSSSLTINGCTVLAASSPSQIYIAIPTINLNSSLVTAYQDISISNSNVIQSISSGSPNPPASPGFSLSSGLGSESISITNSTLSFTNSRTATGNNVNFGMQTNEVNMARTNVTLNNKSAVVPLSSGIVFCSPLDPTENITIDMNPGSLTVVNEGNVGVGNGISAFGVVTAPLASKTYVTLNHSAVNLSNSGTINGGATNAANSSVGVLFGSFSQLNMNNTGITLNKSTGSLVGPYDFGNVMLATNIIQSGGLVINNDTVSANLYVLNYGDFVGSGVVIPHIFNGGTLQFSNNGTIIPGSGSVGGQIGTLTIAGNYTQTGNLVINFDNNKSSLLKITGNAVLGGRLIVADTANRLFDLGETYTILTADQGIKGRFSQIDGYEIPYAYAEIFYLPNQVNVEFVPTLFPRQSFIELGDPKGGYVNLSRPIFSSVNETYIRLTQEMGRLRSRFTPETSSRKKETAEKDKGLIRLVSFENELPQEKREKLTETLPNPERPWNLYVGPKGQIGNVVSDVTLQGYKYSSAGLFSGFDYAFSEAGIGFITEYERFDAKAGKKWGTFLIHSLHSDIYATYAPSQLQELSVNGIVGAGYEWFEVNRRLNLISPFTEKGDPKGAEFDAYLGVEYAFKESVFSCLPKNVQIIPQASLQYTYLHIDSYKEKNISLYAMEIKQQNIKSLRSTLGFRINSTWEWNQFEVSSEAHFNWQREYQDKDRTLISAPVNFSQYVFPVPINQIPRNTALTGIDVVIDWNKRHGLEVGYDFEYNPNYHTHFLYLDYKVRF